MRPGLKYFFHPEQDWFRFFEDPAHPELSRVHRIDWFTDNTDPKLVFFEPDTMHALAGRGRFVDPVDGRLFDINAWYSRLAAKKRLIAWHIKDADRIIPLPPPGTNPFTQERSRSGFPLNNGTDVVYVGEGSIGRGYPVDPDPEVRGFQATFTRFGLSNPGWFNTESDLGPGRRRPTRADRCGGPRSAPPTCAGCARTARSATTTADGGLVTASALPGPSARPPHPSG